MTNAPLKITREMQDAFARLSGDVNPQHVDEIAARRLMFGMPVVHGIHSLLRVLEAVAEARAEARALASLRVSFDLPVAIGEPLELTLDGTFPEVKFALQRDGRKAVRGRASFSATPSPEHRPSPLPGGLVCRTRGAAEIDDAHGALPIGYDPDLFQSLFPNLFKTFDREQVAMLLTATRLVGMECPGLHSIFGGLKMTFHPAAAPCAALDYRVTTWNPEFRLLQMAISCPHAEGIIDAFLRPPPVAQADMATIRSLIGRRSFHGRTALVIGGSRGLGETTAKIIAAGGGRVVLTYAAGEDDAWRVAADIAAAGGQAKSAHFDVRNPAPLDAPFGPFDRVYYFATPRIPHNEGKSLDADIFARLLDYYATGLVRCAAALRPLLADTAVLCAPSTVFIDRPDPRFREYALAKQAGEATALGLADAALRVVCPRLPRLRTDQTSALQDVGAADPLPALLAMIDRAEAAA
ncbi:SDR family NAD(P)-dependent oxidoreductase [Oleispirillum naphthae]|uniref:SDR family NAD(P)-dependent oxidoreductase n=1 Tax=Oleispirillum naphthae TaxID=2838853 RepID=UPI0030826657